MSIRGSSSITCDYARPPRLSDFVSEVGKRFGARTMAVADVTAVEPARWNTPSGARPTQKEADAMAVPPQIVTPVDLRIVRLLKGESTPRIVTAFISAGTVGNETRETSCTIYLDPKGFVTWAGQLIKAGGRYLVFLSNATEIRTDIDPIAKPRIDTMFRILGEDVIGPSGDPERIPQAQTGR